MRDQVRVTEADRELAGRGAGVAKARVARAGLRLAELNEQPARRDVVGICAPPVEVERLAIPALRGIRRERIEGVIAGVRRVARRDCEVLGCQRGFGPMPRQLRHA